MVKKKDMISDNSHLIKSERLLLPPVLLNVTFIPSFLLKLQAVSSIVLQTWRDALILTHPLCCQSYSVSSKLLLSWLGLESYSLCVSPLWLHLTRAADSLQNASYSEARCFKRASRGVNKTGAGIQPKTKNLFSFSMFCGWVCGARL